MLILGKINGYNLLSSNKSLNESKDELIQNWIELAENGANNEVWKRGFLTKGHGLCHGVGGNGYTFLTLYRMYWNNKNGNDTESQRLDALYKAFQFANFASNPNTTFPVPNDRPYSLFEGLLGGCVFTMDTLFAPETSAFPCFEYNL